MFAAVEPAWRTSEFPFLRLGADPALLLAMAPVGSDGHVFGTVAYWRAIVDNDALPDSPAAWEKLEDSDSITLPEFVHLVTALTLPARQATLTTVAFTSRLSARFPASTLADRVFMAHAYRHFPALILTLERADLRDWQTWLALVGRARHLDQTVNGAGLDVTMALFQAPIVLVERALRTRALQRATAESLLKTFAALPSGGDHYGRDVANWIATSLLPSLGYQHDKEGLQAEGVLLEALSGLATPQTAAP